MSHRDDAFIKVFIGVLAGLVVFTIAIIILANAVGTLEIEGISGSPMGEKAVSERIRPVGQVKVAGQATTAPAAAAPAERSGKEIVQAACAACHSAGVAGAPKLGDKAGWASRAEQGLAALLDHSINGYRGMPARGGNPNLSDEEIEKAIKHMLEEAGVSASAAPAQSAVAPPAESQQAPAAADVDGMQVYVTACAACHAAGVAGAPRLGDKAAWETRLNQGMDMLNQHAVKGFRAMPPKGGRMDLSDADVEAAVDYMVKESQ